MTELINTLFDVLSYHITRIKNDLIVIGLKDMNKLDNILKRFSDISKLNNKEYLYLYFGENYFEDNSIEDTINDISESKKHGCDFVIINNYDYMLKDKANSKSLPYNFKKLCTDLNMNIVLFKQIDNNESLGELGNASDLILTEKDDHFFKTIKNNYGDLWDLLY